jgi:hypothetical protein
MSNFGIFFEMSRLQLSHLTCTIDKTQKNVPKGIFKMAKKTNF